MPRFSFPNVWFGFFRLGTCGSTNGTIRCQSTFPNTFNITAATIADIAASNSSNPAATYAQQFEQYTSTTLMNHTRVHRLSEAVCSILIASVILGFFFLPLGFFESTSDPKSGTVRVLSVFLLLDWCAQCVAVVIVYLIIRNEITSTHGVFLGINSINSTHSPVKFELDFWMLVGATVSRLLSAVFVVFSSQSAKAKPEQQWQDQHWQDQQWQGQDRQDQQWQGQHWQGQGERLGGIRISKSPRGTCNLEDKFYENFTSKIASIIKRLRKAVEIYEDKHNLDMACKRLFAEFRDDEEPASLMPNHFYQLSAALFPGIHSEKRGISPGPLLYEECPHRGTTKAPDPRRRGVYLVIVRECCHRSTSPINTLEYKYVGSGAGQRGVVGRVEQPINPGYRETELSQLYEAWDSILEDPCVAIYQLAEWDPLEIGVGYKDGKGFGEILLAEAI